MPLVSMKTAAKPEPKAEPKKKRERIVVEPEYFEMAIPARNTNMGPERRALMDMPVDKDAMMFFQLPEGMDYRTLSNRLMSHINAARRQCPGASYVKRPVEIDGKGLGVGVWRVK